MRKGMDGVQTGCLDADKVSTSLFGVFERVKKISGRLEPNVCDER